MPAALPAPATAPWLTFLLLLPALLLLPLAVLSTDSGACDSPSCSTELAALMAARSSIKDPFNSLSSWDLAAHFCAWNGVICHNSNSSTHVSAVALHARNLSGGIPSSLFSLPSVDTIDLSSNTFSGELGSLALPPTLRSLNLSDNNFTGGFSFAFLGWSSLEVLDLSNNFLSGEIPGETIQLFANLTVLDLGGNALRGRIPPAISNLRKLQFLTLASNELVGEIPPEIARITTLRWIYAGYNNLSGEIPPEMGNMTALDHLDLVYNHLTGQIPATLGKLVRLRYLFLYMNHLSGPIPPSIYNLTALISLDLSDNSLSGEVDSDGVSQLRDLEILHLFSNRLVGKIPPSVASLPRLRVLQLWSNAISGEIPVDLGVGNGLTVLDLSSNKLTGGIPEHLCSSGHLSRLILFSNSIRGGIPRGVSSCRSLQRVRLEDNLLSGELPSQLTQLPLVYYLDLSGNEFPGRIDDRRWVMPALKMLKLARNQFVGTLPDYFGGECLETLDLSENRFTGFISAGIGRFLGLAQLKLSGNLLTGPIPESITLCQKLVHVDLSNNELSGEIPEGLSGLPELSELDLSENKFSGEIPRDLGRNQSLVTVNVSNNHLRGVLPDTAAFVGINSSAVAGNHGLCGGSPKSELPACESPHWQFSVTALSAVLLLLSLSLFVLLLFRQRRRRELDQFIKKVGSGDGSGVWEVKVFDERASNLAARDGFLSSIKEGSVVSYGDVRLAVSEASAEPPELFGWGAVGAIGRFRHPNVACLVAACRSERRWVFLYEFVGGGKRLGGSGGVLRGLAWGQRWSVAVGAGRVLHSLHRRCRLTGFHRTISPEHMLLVEEEDGAEPRLRLRLHVPGSSPPSGCGLPPEVREGKPPTEQSDVHSFGVLLIQLLTGRCPGDLEVGGARDDGVVRWAHRSYADCHVEKWVDPAMPALRADEEAQIVGTMDLAVRCTAADPAARPGMRDVLRHLVAVRKGPARCHRLLSSLLPETYP